MTVVADVNVSTAALRAALVSVVPHVSEDRDDHLRYRVRIYVGPGELKVVATSGMTAAIAVVPIQEHGSFELGCFDLHPMDVKHILQLFNPPKNSSGHVLQLVRSEKHLTVNDVGGLFPGESLRLNGYATDAEYPDIAAAIGLVQRQRTMSLAGFRPSGARLATPGYRLGKFVPASNAYDCPLIIEPSGPWAAPIITCGEQFVGMLVPDYLPTSANEFYNDVREKWTDRFNDVTASHPSPPPQPIREEPVRPRPTPEQQALRDLSSLLAGPSNEPIDLDGVDAGDDDHDDEPPPEVESLPMFADAIDQAVDVELPEPPDPQPDRGFADTASEVLTRTLLAVELLAESGAETISTVELKGLLNCGHAKASITLGHLMDVGAVDVAGNTFRPRKIRFGPGRELTAAEVTARLREQLS